MLKNFKNNSFIKHIYVAVNYNINVSLYIINKADEILHYFLGFYYLNILKELIDYMSLNHFCLILF